MWVRVLVVLVVLSSSVFGQSSEFLEGYRKELKSLGHPSPDALKAFTALQPVEIEWDPTEARFWKELNTKPVDPGPRKMAKPDFSLLPEEVALFKKNGFLVSERLGRDTMTGVLYRVYNADLPVFISADSILHPWHQSFADSYSSIELQFLAPTLGGVLRAMHGVLPTALAECDDESLRPAYEEVDLLLATALSLCETKVVKTKFGQDRRVSSLLSQCKALAPTRIEFGGRLRNVDFGALKLRGRHEKQPRLHGYFRAVTFLQQFGLKLGTSELETQCSVVLVDALRRSGQVEQWRKFEEVQDRLVGKMDGASALQLSELMEKGETPADWSTILDRILASRLGIEQISSYQYYPQGAGEVRPVRVCYLTGARFTYGSWLFNQVTFGRIEWKGQRVQRRLPSGVDIGFAILANNQLGPEIMERISKQEVAWRDGLPYHHNLMAARTSFDQLFDERAQNLSVVARWLKTLRSLSLNPDPRAPRVTRTAPWRLRLANTQLASWTQLRHTILADAKPSFTGGTLCSYPEGYVEPNPLFWSNLREMSDEMVEVGRIIGERNRVSAFYERFSSKLMQLEGIAEKQLTSRELTPEEVKFLQTMMETGPHSSGGANYSGWYFQLFYNLGGDDFPERWEPSVADVHISPADDVTGAPRMVLSQGTGAADLLVVSIENEGDRCIYLGPTTSYYEWTSERRLSDQEWKTVVEKGDAAPRPSWTSPYLQPVR